MTPRAVYPELVTCRDDDFEERGWTVVPGQALRGHASCDFVNRVLEVPTGEGVVERVVRAHELVHVRVSPHDVNPLSCHPDLSPRALECAEEFRVNHLLGRLGFAANELRDGSEAVVGERLASAGEWAEAVCFFIVTVGTGAERDFLRGVRRAAPEWVKPLGVIRRRAVGMLTAFSVAELGSTVRHVELGDLPEGFRLGAVPVARLLVTAGASRVPQDANQLRQFRRSLEPGGRRAPSGVFAELVLLECLDHVGTTTSVVGQGLRPAVTGTTLRYPNRLLTDPHRRAFARPHRRPGGVVLIDQSGSMDLDLDELDRVLLQTPAATIIGYSHRPGDRTGLANAWVVARHGRRAAQVPSGNVGNGVDGPVLRWALAQRRGGECVVWVTDGQITDSHDHPNATLAAECAALVVRHRVAVVRTLGEAAGPLRGRRDRLEPLSSFGRLGRAVASLQQARTPFDQG